MAVNFSLDDLKSPQWFHNDAAGNRFALHYNINGQGHTFIPEEYISKGYRDGDTQYYNSTLLREGTLENIFNQGALVDLTDIAPNWALNALDKTGLGAKGVIVPNSTLKDTGVLQNNGLFSSVKKYEVDPNSRTQGELLGLTNLDGQYVYLKKPQGDRAGITYTDENGRTRAEYTKVRGGWLGGKIVDVAESFAEVPLLPEVIGAITGSPALYASLKGFQTAGSGGDLKDVFESGVKAYVSAGGLRGTPNLSTEAVTALETMNAVTGEEDPLQAFITQYGANQLGEVLEGSDFANYAKSSLTDVVGADTVNFLEDNFDYVKAGKDILIDGKDPSEVLVDRFGNEIVSGLNAQSPTERALAFAGLKTGVALDQGLSNDEALLAGAEEYITRGGGLPNFNALASATGIKDFNVGIPDLGFDIPELQDFGLDLRQIADFGVDISGLGLSKLFEGGFTIPEIQGLGLDVSIPDLEGLGFDIPQIADLGFDISSLGLEGLESRGLTLPEIRGYGVDISKLQFPDLQARGFGLGDIGYLGFDIASMDFSGYRPGDLGDYSLPELKDMGVNIRDLNLAQ